MRATSENLITSSELGIPPPRKRARCVEPEDCQGVRGRIVSFYNRGMARGWESKSIEAQIEENNSTSANQGDHRAVSQEEVHSKIRKNNLLLSRKRILQQLESSTSERYSEQLRRSLAELDAQLKATSD